MTTPTIATDTLDDHLLRLLGVVTPDRVRDNDASITLTAGPETTRDHDVTREIRYLNELGLVEQDGTGWARTAVGDICIAEHGRHVIEVTSQPLSTEYLAIVQARVAAANPLPWTLVPRECPKHGPHFDLHGGAVSDNPVDWWLNEIVSHNGGQDCTDGYPLTEGNAEFLMHAREDVPALLAEITRLRSACNNPNFTCLSGEYCDGCQAADDARTAMERELRDLRNEVAELRLKLGEQRQVSAVLDDYAMGYKP